MTKSFVAAAVLLLRDDGRVRLDDPVVEYVPELIALQSPTEDSPPITIRDLMSMSSGLPEDDPWADRLLDLRRTGVDQVFRAGATFAHPPRTAYEYSNLGWVMLGRVITNVTGTPVQAFITQRILQPLSLSSTTWDAPPVDIEKMTGHRWQDGDWLEEDAPLADGDFSPMAGLWSTAEDLVCWMSFLSDAFPSRDGVNDRVLSRASRREMQHVQRASLSEYDASSGRLTAGGYGFGLVVTHDLRFGHIIGHPGGLPGFGSYMRWLPDRGVGVVALGNSTYSPLKLPTLEVLEILDDLGLVPPPRKLEPSAGLVRARDGICLLTESWDESAAADIFAPNVFLDEASDRRQAQLAALRSECGRLVPGGEQIESATRGTFRLKGERRDVTLSLMLSPEVPPRIEWYSMERA